MQSLDFFLAVCNLASDWNGENVGAVFFHARAVEDHDGLFELASSIHSRIKAKIVINGSSGERFEVNIPGEAWPGKGVYRDLLKAHGILHDNISYSRPAFYTREENDAFLEWAKENMVKDAIVIAHPHQLPRIFLGLLHAMKAQNYEMKIFSASPAHTAWCKEVGCNQGIGMQKRYENISDEFSRIIRGQETYKNLASYEELFAYQLRKQ